jgi:hypothetical protein
MNAGENNPDVRGFILMPFDDDLDWLHQTIRRAGDAVGCRMERADDIFTSGVIIEQVRDKIEQADAVVAVCTGQNPNVFFEMGLAWRQRFPILLAESADDLPFDVRHLRTLLYAGTSAGQDRDTLEERLAKAISATAAERPTPVGRRLVTAPERRQSARVAARITGASNGRRLQITNTGTQPLHGLDFELPPEASSFQVMAGDELPVEILRPGESVTLLVASFLGGGKRNFDVSFTAKLDDGSPFQQAVKLSTL